MAEGRTTTRQRWWLLAACALLVVCAGCAAPTATPTTSTTPPPETFDYPYGVFYDDHDRVQGNATVHFVLANETIQMTAKFASTPLVATLRSLVANRSLESAKQDATGMELEGELRFGTRCIPLSLSWRPVYGPTDARGSVSMAVRGEPGFTKAFVGTSPELASNAARAYRNEAANYAHADAWRAPGTALCHDG